MGILQGGVPKCGNFWLYQIIQQVLKMSGKDTTSFIEKQPIYALAKHWELNFPDQARIDVLETTDLQDSYRISSIFRMPIDNIRDYAAQTNHVWTHSPICKRSGEVLHQFDKKVYIVRDPRDRAVSAAKYYCSEYMLKYFPQEEKNPEGFLKKNFDNLMQEWVWHVFDYIRLSHKYDIHIAYFEGFLQDFQKELQRLLAYLEVKLTTSQTLALEKAVSFSTLKSKNPKHLKKGKAGYWKEYLTSEQIEKAAIIAGPLMRYLNYSENGMGGEKFVPREIGTDLTVLKEEIIDAQSFLYDY